MHGLMPSGNLPEKPRTPETNQKLYRPPKKTDEERAKDFLFHVNAHLGQHLDPSHGFALESAPGHCTLVAKGILQGMDWRFILNEWPRIPEKLYMLDRFTIQRRMKGHKIFKPGPWQLDSAKIMRERWNQWHPYSKEFIEAHHRECSYKRDEDAKQLNDEIRLQWVINAVRKVSELRPERSWQWFVGARYVSVVVEGGDFTKKLAELENVDKMVKELLAWEAALPPCSKLEWATAFRERKPQVELAYDMYDV